MDQTSVPPLTPQAPSLVGLDVPPPPPPSNPASEPPKNSSPSPVPPVSSIPPSSSRPSLPGASKILTIGGIVLGLIILVAIGFAIFTRFFKTPEQTVLTYWGLWESEASMKPLFDEYVTAHPGIKIEYKMQSGQEYRERLQSALSQGKGPDIFRVHNTWVPMFRNSLTPIPADVYSAAEFEQTFYPTARYDLRAGGSYLAIPLEYDGLAMYVNDDLFKVANLPVPDNWEDLRADAISLTLCDTPNGVCSTNSPVLVAGAALGTTNNIDHWQDIVGVLMLQNNVNLAAPDNPTYKPAQDVLDYYSSFVKKVRVWDSVLPSSTNMFADGKLAIYFGPSWRVFDIKLLNPSLHFSIHPLPQLPLSAERKEQPVTWSTYWAEGVNKQSSHQKEAWELLKFLSSKETQPKFYQQGVSSKREFGEPYSRVDLADSLKTNSLVWPFVQQAPYARSWYLSSFTHDGQSGLNAKISDLYAQAIDNKIGIDALAKELNKVLSGYGLATGLPAAQ
jgi:multiple sugar transport system substrate-binding protein